MAVYGDLIARRGVEEGDGRERTVGAVAHAEGGCKRN